MFGGMCGIAGCTDDPDGRVAQTMSATLRHRGPDDQGNHTDPATNVTISVRRLAIIDVEGGHQPLSNEDGSVWVVFNGEIYNHALLRERLLAHGHRFRTDTDTEALVHLYEELGEAMVHALEGMFAFALWDEKERRLLLARDRFGEKPLFLHERDGQLAFASELTALLEAKPYLRELDAAAIDAFFVLGYIPGPATVVPGIRQLPPGHLLSWEWERRRGAERCWWSPPRGRERLRESSEMLAAETRELVLDSVRSRLIADVPVGVFLSGGIDSTLVTATAAQESSRRVKTFTIGYDTGPFDETADARAVAHALGTEHHEVTLRRSDVAARVPSLLASLDQPLADQALVPLHALCEFARPLATVALGGEGADELFGGYPRYRWLERVAPLQPSLPGVASRALARRLRSSLRSRAGARLTDLILPQTMLERHLDWMTEGRRHARAGLYGPRLSAANPESVLSAVAARAGRLDGGSTGRWLMHLDQIDYLPDDVLVKSDRAGMLVSLEIRTVYLHRELAELAASIDTSLHLRGSGKALLHEALASGLMPRSPCSRGPSRYRKTAFRAPTAQWLRGPLAALLQGQLREGIIYEEGYIDRVAAAALVTEHLSAVHDHSDLLWPLLALGVWADEFYGRDGR
jgi:asparagine synthase (glutamine-hydrolysing)